MKSFNSDINGKYLNKIRSEKYKKCSYYYIFINIMMYFIFYFLFTRIQIYNPIAKVKIYMWGISFLFIFITYKSMLYYKLYKYSIYRVQAFIFILHILTILSSIVTLESIIKNFNLISLNGKITLIIEVITILKNMLSVYLILTVLFYIIKGILEFKIIPLLSIIVLIFILGMLDSKGIDGDQISIFLIVLYLIIKVIKSNININSFDSTSGILIFGEVNEDLLFVLLYIIFKYDNRIGIVNYFVKFIMKDSPINSEVFNIGFENFLLLVIIYLFIFNKIIRILYGVILKKYALIVTPNIELDTKIDMSKSNIITKLLMPYNTTAQFGYIHILLLDCSVSINNIDLIRKDYNNKKKCNSIERRYNIYGINKNSNMQSIFISNIYDDKVSEKLNQNNIIYELILNLETNYDDKIKYLCMCNINSGVSEIIISEEYQITIINRSEYFLDIFDSSDYIITITDIESDVYYYSYNTKMCNITNFNSVILDVESNQIRIRELNYFKKYKINIFIENFDVSLEKESDTIYKFKAVVNPLNKFKLKGQSIK